MKSRKALKSARAQRVNYVGHDHRVVSAVPRNIPPRLNVKPTSLERDVVTDKWSVKLAHRLVENARPLVPRDRPALLPVTNLHEAKTAMPRRQRVISWIAW
jgi:hypothetical protein